MDDRELTRWVEERVALLDPPEDWEPNAKVARARYEARRQSRSRVGGYLLIAAAALAVACFVLPGVPRALAQSAGGVGLWYRVERLWDFVTMMHMNPPIVFQTRSLPEGVKAVRARVFARIGTAQAAADAREAARRAGFIPRMPKAGTMPDPPRISTLAPMSISATIGTGGVGAEIAKQWVIELRMGPAVLAEWAGASGADGIDWADVTLAQGAAPVITGTAGFNVDEFTGAVLRTYRATRAARDPNFHAGSASRLDHFPAVTAALMIGDGTEDSVAVNQANLRTGAATMIEGLRGGKTGRLTVLWIAADRMYVLSGELATPVVPASLDVTGAMTSLIEIANSIE